MTNDKHIRVCMCASVCRITLGKIKKKHFIRSHITLAGNAR